MWQLNWQNSFEYCTIAQSKDIITTQKCHKNSPTWAHFVEKFDRTLTSWQSTCRQICSAYVLLPYFLLKIQLLTMDIMHSQISQWHQQHLKKVQHELWKYLNCLIVLRTCQEHSSITLVLQIVVSILIVKVSSSPWNIFCCLQLIT